MFLDSIPVGVNGMFYLARGLNTTLTFFKVRRISLVATLNWREPNLHWYIYIYPTGRFTILEPQNQEIVEFFEQQKRRATYFNLQNCEGIGWVVRHTSLKR